MSSRILTDDEAHAVYVALHKLAEATGDKILEARLNLAMYEIDDDAEDLSDVLINEIGYAMIDGLF